jgi:hypothetical protein
MIRMMTELAAILGISTQAVGLAKGATEFAQGIKGLVNKPDVDAGELKQLVSDLLDRLLRLQKEQLAMQAELLDFQNEQGKRSRFHGEKHRYTMVKTELGAIIYSLKPDDARGELPHDLCTNCFDDDVKSVLQPVDFNTLGCPKCGSKFFKPDGRASIMMGSVSRRDAF